MKIEEKWIKWAREIQALAQTGLTFADNNYEIERNNRLVAIGTEILEEYTDKKSSEIKKIMMEQPGYATPKVDVRSAVIKDGRILLVKEISDGKWAMPGGWMDVGNMPAEAAERETLEESGFIVKAEKLLGVFDANRTGRPLEFFHAVKLIFLCSIVGGEATTSYETSDVNFFEFNNLPELSQNRTNQKHLFEIQEHLKDRNRITYFE